MYSRRTFTLGSVAATFAAATKAHAQATCAVLSKEVQTNTTPLAALKMLKDGNARFLTGHTAHCELKAQVRVAGEQHPFAAVVGCIDSRVSPEFIFDQHVGSLFVARVAGNVMDTHILGSLEYACEHAGAKLILVLGHTDCGAVKGAIDGFELGNLTALLDHIQPAVAHTKTGGVRNSTNKQFFDDVVGENAKRTAQQILARSSILNKMVLEKKINLAVAVELVETGKVIFLVDAVQPNHPGHK